MLNKGIANKDEEKYVKFLKKIFRFNYTRTFFYMNLFPDPDALFLSGHTSI